jgi:hypothetical protein
MTLNTVFPEEKITNNSSSFRFNPLREWAPVKRLKLLADEGVCGKLCSLRFTWQKPKKDAHIEDVFLYEILAGLIDIGRYFANASIDTLHIERVPEKNNLFALVMFENEIAAEFELNECLPDSMPATHFIKANFTNGHITNQPIVGHFNEEGSVFADDAGMRRIIVENSEWDDCEEDIELCRRKMQYAMKSGNIKYHLLPVISPEIIEAVKFSIKHGTYVKGNAGIKKDMEAVQ